MSNSTEAVDSRRPIDAHRWLADLPAELGAQTSILARLLHLCETTGDARVLLVGCSIARGAADRLSDVDCFIGTAAGTAPAVLAAVHAVLPDMGTVVDVLQHSYAGELQRIFAQFASGAQLDLVVAEAHTGRAPDEVVLYDPDARMAGDRRPTADVVGPDDIGEWAFLGWTALADMHKYLQRDSGWEALARLTEARDRIWALWAAARGARYPAFGLSQVLDRDAHDLPPGIAATVAGLAPDELRRAAAASCSLLSAVTALAVAEHGGRVPQAMADHVTALFPPAG